MSKEIGPKIRDEGRKDAIGDDTFTMNAVQFSVASELAELVTYLRGVRQEANMKSLASLMQQMQSQ